MKKFEILATSDKRIRKLSGTLLKLSLLLSLSSTLILCFYISNCILFWYNIGLVLLKTSITIISSTIICYIAFSKMIEDVS